MSSTSSTYSYSEKSKTSMDSTASYSPLAEKGSVMEKESKLKKLGRKFVEAAKEHHRDVNAAYEAYYGMGTQRSRMAAAAGYRGNGEGKKA
ncbi:hypothetical protein B0O99DRAFT_610160 [Bisporella sp. PMI_857]|jgi:hypothetical protein|nr:hypothetical protein B0O99DRAFT_610160 [Bisporella sp. PMI_857]